MTFCIYDIPTWYRNSYYSDNILDFKNYKFRYKKSDSVRYSGHLFMSLSFMKCLGKKLKSIAKLYADSWIGKMQWE